MEHDGYDRPERHRYVVHAEFPPDRDALRVYLRRYDPLDRTSQYARHNEHLATIEWVAYEPYETIRPFIEISGIEVHQRRQTPSWLVDELIALARQPRPEAQLASYSPFDAA